MNCSDSFHELIEMGFVITPTSCYCGGWYAWINPNKRMVGCVCHNEPRWILKEWRRLNGDRVIGIFSKDQHLGRNFQISLIRIQDIRTTSSTFPEILMKDGRKYRLYNYPFEPHCGVRHNKIYISTALKGSEYLNTVIRPFLCYPFDDQPEVWFNEETGEIFDDE